MSHDAAEQAIELKVLDARLGAQFPLPDYATALSAGMDLRALCDAPLELAPHSAPAVCPQTGITLTTARLNNRAI